MRVQENHAHADTRYKALSITDFYLLFNNCLETYFKKYKTLNVHLPYELQHPHAFPRKRIGSLYVRFGELLKRIFRITLVWENAPVLIVGVWSLAYGQTNLDTIPRNIDLCLDTGHLMLDSSNPRKTIETFLNQFGKQVKHIHLHENNLIADQHIPPSKYLTPNFVRTITKNRTWIIEKPE